jgi:hypothetical protein
MSDKEFFNYIIMIRDNDNVEYQLLIKEMMGKYGILIENYINRSLEITTTIPFKEDVNYMNRINELFYTPVSKIDIKWKYNILVDNYNFFLYKLIYFNGYRLEYTNHGLAMKYCMPEFEFQMILNNDYDIIDVANNVVFYAEGYIFNNIFVKRQQINRNLQYLLYNTKLIRNDDIELVEKRVKQLKKKFKL